MTLTVGASSQSYIFHKLFTQDSTISPIFILIQDNRFSYIITAILLEGEVQLGTMRCKTKNDF